MKRILITGSRNWPVNLRWVVNGAITDAIQPDTEAIVVQGGAQGADRWASLWVQSLRALFSEFRANPEDDWYVSQWIPHVVDEEVRADWDRFGRSAGHIRNQVMVDRGADICLAFPLPDSRGTLHCMKAADLAGIPVRVYSADGTWTDYATWKQWGKRDTP